MKMKSLRNILEIIFSFLTTTSILNEWDKCIQIILLGIAFIIWGCCGYVAGIEYGIKNSKV